MVDFVVRYSPKESQNVRCGCLWALHTEIWVACGDVVLFKFLLEVLEDLCGSNVVFCDGFLLADTSEEEWGDCYAFSSLKFVQERCLVGLGF